MNALQILAEMNINTTNRIRAVQDAGALEFDENAYRRIIGELTGNDDVNVSDDAARHTFMYLVQDIVEGQLTDSIDLASAEAKAEAYVKKNPWVLVKPEHESYYQPKSTVDALGKPKQKKGAKKDAAIAFWKANQDKYTTRQEWIEALAENVGLTKAAASTYHYNLRKGIYK